MTPETKTTDYGIGIPLGLRYQTDKPLLVGQVLYQHHVIALDALSYFVWLDAITGRIDMDRLNHNTAYWPESAQHLPHALMNPTRTLSDVLQALDTLGLLWHWSPDGFDPQRVWDRFLIMPQGIPIGNRGQADRYVIERFGGTPAIACDEIAYMLWLHWYSQPQVKTTVAFVAHELSIAESTVFAKALSTIITGLQANLLFVDEENS